MEEQFFGRKFNFFILVVFFSFSFISNNNNIAKKEISNDTIINLLNRYIIDSLKNTSDVTLHTLKYNECFFYIKKGYFFTNEFQHVIVEYKKDTNSIMNNYFQIYSLKKDTIKKLFDYNFLCIFNPSFIVMDFNYDNVKDIAFKWTTCSGSVGMSFNINIYNADLDTFLYKKELDFFSGIYMDTISKAIITEDRVNSNWKKYIWHEYDTEIIEEIQFDNKFAFYFQNKYNICERTIYNYENGVKKLKDVKKTCNLPVNWFTFTIL